MRDPAFQVKRKGTIGKNPFTIVFPGDVYMCPRYFSAFAGGITDDVSRMELFS